MSMTINLNEVRARKIADEQAAEMRRKLETLTPAQMGWPNIRPDELVESEWRCWFDAEIARLEIISYVK